MLREFLVVTSVLTYKLFWDINIMKITYTHPYHSLVESAQKNPIRWVCLQKRLGDFTNTTPAFKCKDYFNAFVVYRHMKKVFSQYGMQSNQAKYDRKGGMWVLLANVTDYLQSNIENCINSEFGNTWDIKLVYTPLEDGVVVGDLNNLEATQKSLKCGLLYIPKQALTNTLRISIMTLLIRNCNIDHQLYSYDELIQPNIAADGQLDNARYNMLKERKYNFASEKNFIYHNGVYENSNTEWPSYGYRAIHNCGIGGFTMGFIDEIGVKGFRENSIQWGEDDDEEDEYALDDEGCV